MCIYMYKDIHVCILKIKMIDIYILWCITFPCKDLEKWVKPSSYFRVASNLNKMNYLGIQIRIQIVIKQI